MHPYLVILREAVRKEGISIYILREIHPCAERTAHARDPRGQLRLLSQGPCHPLLTGLFSPSSWSTNVCFACLTPCPHVFVLFDIQRKGHSYHDVLITPLRSRYTSQTRGSLACIGVMDCIAAPVTRLPVFTASPQLGNLRLLLFLFLLFLFLFFFCFPLAGQISYNQPREMEKTARTKREKKRTKKKISADRGTDGDTGIRSGCVVQEEAPEAANLKVDCGEEKFYLRPWQWHPITS